MGKKHIIEADQEELMKEKEKVDKAVEKETKVKAAALGGATGKNIRIILLQ